MKRQEDCTTGHVPMAVPLTPSELLAADATALRTRVTDDPLRHRGVVEVTHLRQRVGQLPNCGAQTQPEDDGSRPNVVDPVQPLGEIPFLPEAPDNVVMGLNRL